MEEYEHFSEEFKTFWNRKPSYSPEVVNTITGYNKEKNKTILKNMAKLENCIKQNTEHLSTKLPYDIKFRCYNLYGLPEYNVIEQGYGDISQPYVSSDYKKLKYLEKPLQNIGLKPSYDDKNGPGKNEYYMHPGGDMNEAYNFDGYIDIRVSNSNIPSDLDKK